MAWKEISNPLDNDLSDGKYYQTFKQLFQDVYVVTFVAAIEEKDSANWW